MHLTQTKLKNLRKVINTQNYEGTFRYTMADAALACKAAGCLFEYERLVCMAGQARGTTPTTTSQSGIAIDDTETSDPLLREKKNTVSKCSCVPFRRPDRRINECVWCDQPTHTTDQ